MLEEPMEMEMPEPVIRLKKPQTTQWSEDICGVHTDFAVTTFAKSLHVIVTQNKRIATTVHASIDDSEAGNLIFSSKILFGDREKGYNEVYGRAVIQMVSKLGVSSVILGLQVPEGPEIFHAVLGSLKERLC